MLTSGRALLYGSSACAIGLGVRSAMHGAVPLSVAGGAIVGFSAVVLAGVFELRLGMFVDAVNAGEPNPEAPRVALTFDDGPSQKTTPRVLDALAEANAQATFFVIGKKLDAEGKALVRRAHEAGHAIGCHSFAHDRLFAMRSARRVKEDLQRALSTLEDALGDKTHLFRPPIGHTNPSIARVVEELELTVVGYSVRGYDGMASAQVDRVRERVIAGLKDGAIVLLHDAAEREDFSPAAPEALPAILAAMQEKKLAAVNVDTLLSD